MGRVSQGDITNGVGCAMICGKKILGIIPARGGSKRLPRKNIMLLAGRPLVSWTIDAGCKSKYIDKLIVTSDDEEILSVSKQSGAYIFKRPDELASDTATTFEVVKNLIDNMPGYNFIVLLQPTSPLRNERHIDAAIELLMQKNADAIISICETEHSPLWCNTIPEDGSMRNFLRDELKNKRSQDIDKYYRLNGAIYICNTDKLLQEKSFFIQDNMYGYIMENKYSLDIDNAFDFKFAEFLIQELMCEKN